MFAKSLIFLSFLVAVSIPVVLFAVTKAEVDDPNGPYAKALVPCGYIVSDNNDQIYKPCDFNSIIKVAQKIINFLIQLGVTAAALGFAYAGFLYITAMGSEEKIKRAHSIFIKVIWGFVFMLSAWLIVKVFEDSFLTTTQKQKSFLDQ